MDAEELYYEAYKAECALYLDMIDEMSEMQQAKAEMNARTIVYEAYPCDATFAAKLDAEWNYTDFEQARRKEYIQKLTSQYPQTLPSRAR